MQSKIHHRGGAINLAPAHICQTTTSQWKTGCLYMKLTGNQSPKRHAVVRPSTGHQENSPIYCQSSINWVDIQLLDLISEVSSTGYLTDTHVIVLYHYFCSNDPGVCKLTGSLCLPGLVCQIGPGLGEIVRYRNVHSVRPVHIPHHWP